MFQGHFEVCVIGGGPAGSAVALRLALFGHRVALVERSSFPRNHVGESLTIGAVESLKLLGLIEPFPNDAFLEANDTLICWTDPEPIRITRGQGGHAILVDRGRFDAHLLRGAKIAGVHILQPAQARAAANQESGWRVDTLSGIESRWLSADYLVDATGRNGFLRTRRQRDAQPTLALCGYVKHPDGLHATLIEAICDGWCWGAPIPGDRFSTMVFLDPRIGHNLGRADLEICWRSCLTRTTLFAAIASLPLKEPIVARDATSSHVRDPIGSNYLRVGEASYSLDPLSSTGVEKALRTGLIAAITLHTMIRWPERRPLCQRFYQARHFESVTSHSRWSAEFYRKVARFTDYSFWQSRSKAGAGAETQGGVARQQLAVPTISPSTVVRLSKDAQLVEDACIVDNEIVARPVLLHPGLERPIAFLEGVEVGPLLAMLDSTPSFSGLLALWSKRVSSDRARRIMVWLLRNQILEPD